MQTAIKKSYQNHMVMLLAVMVYAEQMCYGDLYGETNGCEQMSDDVDDVDVYGVHAHADA